MSLVESLLGAIIRLDGDSLVLHTGEKPYVVTSSSTLNAFRGPVAWGQVELSTRVLTLDALTGMLEQLFTQEQLRVLDELGAVENEIAALGERPPFRVIAARGGEDVWVEIRPVRPPTAAPMIETPPAAEAASTAERSQASPEFAPAARAGSASFEVVPDIEQEEPDAAEVAQLLETSGLMQAQQHSGVRLDAAAEEAGAARPVPPDLTGLREEQERLAAALREEEARLETLRREAQRLESEQAEQAARLAAAREEAEREAVRRLEALRTENEQRIAAQQDLETRAAAQREEEETRLARERTEHEARLTALRDEEARIAAQREELTTLLVRQQEEGARLGALREEQESRVASLRGEESRITSLREEVAALRDAEGAKIAAIRQEYEARLAATREEEARLATVRQELESQLASRRQEELELMARRDEQEALLSARRQEEEARLAAHRQEVEATVAAWRQQEEARLAAQREDAEARRRQQEEAWLAARREEEARLRAQWDEEAARVAAVREEQDALRAAWRQEEEARAASRREQEAHAEALRQEEARIAAVREETTARLAAREEELARLAAAHETEAARLSALRHDEEARLAALRQEEDARLAALQAEEAARVAALREEESRVAAQRDELARLLAEQHAEAARLSTLREEEAARMIAQREEEAARLSALREQEAAQLTALREQEAARLTALREETEAIVAAGREELERIAGEREAEIARLRTLRDAIVGLEAMRQLESDRREATPVAAAVPTPVPPAAPTPPVEAPLSEDVAAAADTDFRPAQIVPLVRTVRDYVHAPASGGAPDIDRLLRIAAARGASGLYLMSESVPALRVDGEVQQLADEEPLAPSDVEAFMLALAPEPSRDAVRRGETYEWFCDVAEVGGVRCLAFHDHRGPGVILRMMPTRTISAEQLGLSRDIQALSTHTDGLVLVTGSRASGKSTLMAAFVDLINRTRADHVITIERQLTFAHESRRAFVSQREVRGEAHEVLASIRAALREDPDVLVIEELRSPEVVATVLEAAESGRLVLAGYRAPSAGQALERIVSQLPVDRRSQALAGLSSTLRAVLAQALLRKRGGGRIAARELLLNTPAAASVIAEGKLFQLAAALESGRKLGSVPLNDALVALIRDGSVEPGEAWRKAYDREGLLTLLKREGIDTSFVERLA